MPKRIPFWRRYSRSSIMNQTGHRSVQMVRRYIRDGSRFRENSGDHHGWPVGTYVPPKTKSALGTQTQSANHVGIMRAATMAARKLSTAIGGA